MTNCSRSELNAEEYADQVIGAYRISDDASDPEWDRGSRIDWVTSEVVSHICHSAHVERAHVDEAAVRAMVERRVAAQRQA
jgi:hypothetical protein